MANLDTLALYTIKSRYTGGGEVSGEVPWHAGPVTRVVGIASGDGGHDIWTPTTPNPFRFGLEYDQGQATSHEVQLPSEMIERFTSFFKDYFVDRPGHGEYLYGKDLRENAPNCHRFAYWLRGDSRANSVELPPEPAARDIQPCGPPFEAGQHAGIYHDYNNLLHSVIGLGRDTNDCLQVFAVNAVIGIYTYDEIMAMNKAIYNSRQLSWAAIRDYDVETT